jgi:hypothetical protein
VKEQTVTQTIPFAKNVPVAEIACQSGKNFSCWANKSAPSVILNFMKVFHLRRTTFCA